MGNQMTQHFSTRKTPQNRKAFDKDQVKNAAGGYVFKISDWNRLNRFLILGSDKGTYYVGEKQLTIENAECVIRCLKEDGLRVVKEIVEISDQGRAARNDSALFSLAIAASHGDTATKAAAFASLHKVARIGTHIFQFAHYISAMRGWGPSLRKAVATWYNNMPAEKLAYQVVKYPQRTTEEGITMSKWSHRDLLSKVHAKGDRSHNSIYEYVNRVGLLAGDRLPEDTRLKIQEKMKDVETVQQALDVIEYFRNQKVVVKVKGKDQIRNIRVPFSYLPKKIASKKTLWDSLLPDAPEILRFAEDMRHADSAASVVSTIERAKDADIKIPHELIPKEFASNTNVWRAMFAMGIPLTATIRTLGRLTSYDVLVPGSQEVKDVVRRLKDEEYIRKSRLHPLSILIAMKTYSQGHGMKGKMSWSPDRKIIDALDEAFYMAFDNVEPTGKRLMLAIDVSGSMSWGFVSGIDNLMPVEAAAVMAMVTARVEDDYEIMGFDHNFRVLGISPRQRLDDVITKMQSSSFGGTDCALPMQYAIKHNMEIDGFVIYTDGETWRGPQHAFEALKEYRSKFVSDARLAVVATTATSSSIADSDDERSLNICGFSTDTPNVISGFLRGDF